MVSLYSITSFVALSVGILLNNALFSWLFKNQDILKDLRLWRNLTLGITAAAFLTPSIWIYFTLLVWIIFAASRKIPIAELFVLTIFLVAYVDVRPIAELFEFNHARVIGLAMVYLLFSAKKLPGVGSNKQFRYPSDPIYGFLLAYVLLTLLLAFIYGNATHTLRLALTDYLDILLPFLIMRRWVTTGAEAQRVFLVLAYVIGYLGMVGIAEGALHRLFFPALQYSWGVDWSQFIWTTRGGALRAQASAAQPIAFGFMMLVGIGSVIALRGFQAVRWLTLPLAVVTLALLASVSRGPWLAGVAMAVMFAATARSAGRNITYMVGGSAIFILVLLMTPYGDRMIDVLPWVGTVEAHNVTFREHLVAYAIAVVKENPFTGLGYFSAPALEQFRTGEGIIDIVNTYAAIALSTGLTGLMPFVLTFVSAIYLGWKTLSRSRKHDPLRADMLRVCVVLLMTTLIVIGTTASITIIPFLYYILLGMTSGMVRNFDAKNEGILPSLSHIEPITSAYVVRR